MEKLLLSMNKHLPAKRRSLAELMLETEPSFKGKDGTVYHMRKAELERIAALIDPYEWERLKLPLFISTDTSYPGGAWKVRGRLETKVISALLDKAPEREDEMRLYFPHMGLLRDLLPTTIVVFFMP
jgi:uncharacterized protein